ncbi:GNAT family N-acetyltransferase [Rugosimonospora africana]|uniref:N-acetyltransferase n=1 Tax=Rugosimonospora africana TaxID=556532 RepID=A0A8J3R5B6_9ACTN|nr:GNAT family N-acetyltransferase [Rugosimonospora africana]GIH20286.1 N-acetyltransferase [Rugosimonospora africana]
MRCYEDRDPVEFARRVWPFLERDPVRTNVIGSILEQSATDGVPPAPGTRWLRVHDGHGLVGVALWTPSHGIGLSPMPTGAAEALADHLAAESARAPRANGIEEPAGVFADRYAGATGRSAIRVTRQGLYRLDRVTPPVEVPGRPRPAVRADRPLILAWLRAFHDDVDPHRPPDDMGSQVDRWLATGPLMWFWEVDGEPVSFARRTPITPGPGLRTTVARVGAVYTPREHRGHGYASANVAAVSQNALESGARACMLYTDLANPTSNKIYQAIGYRPAGTAGVWRFS